MGLGEWFRAFCSNIQVQNVDSISTRYKAIIRRLNTDFWNTTSETAHGLYIGSYGRNTAIRGFSDLDMMFELPSRLYFQYNGYSGNGQSALLQLVRNSIRTTYSRSEVGGDGQVVIVRFSDEMRFEVLPVFENQDGSFTYPDSNAGGSWKTTNPKLEIQVFRTRNSACNNNLVQLCRMMRAWKREWDVPVKGLLIDTLAYQFIDQWPYKDKSYFYYDYMCRDFFLFMKNQSKDQSYWRAPGSGQYVYAGESFHWKATRGYNLSLEAIEHEMATPKREWSAKQKWREIFGNAFPD